MLHGARKLLDRPSITSTPGSIPQEPVFQSRHVFAMFVATWGALASPELVATKTCSTRQRAALSSTDIVHPSLGIGVGRSTRYGMAWPVASAGRAPGTGRAAPALPDADAA